MTRQERDQQRRDELVNDLMVDAMELLRVDVDDLGALAAVLVCIRAHIDDFEALLERDAVGPVDEGEVDR